LLSNFQLAYPTHEIGSINTDPEYVDYANGNFVPTHAAVFNNGLNLLADVPIDINGKVRPIAPTPGAY
jgi:hypothetical protein